MKNLFLIRNYKIGPSMIGIAAVLLIMFPNAVYLFYSPPEDILSVNEASYWLWNILENIGRFGLMITLCIVVNKDLPTKSRLVTIGSVCSLLAYYMLWVAYFAGIFNGLSLVGMAFFPSVFFLLIAWRQRNIFALVFTALFAIMHIAIMSNNFLF